ncbi:MAG: hypothetical protein R3F11_05965 [Verrucomicrobiales bacterium]
MITIERQIWDEENEDPPKYVDGSTTEDATFSFVRPGYAGGALFCDAKRPAGSFDFWIAESGGWFTGSVSGSGSQTLTIFYGGPSNNIVEDAGAAGGGDRHAQGGEPRGSGCRN